MGLSELAWVASSCCIFSGISEWQHKSAQTAQLSVQGSGIYLYLYAIGKVKSNLYMKEQRLRMKENNFEKKNKKYKANPSYQTLELVKIFEFFFFGTTEPTRYT